MKALPSLFRALLCGLLLSVLPTAAVAQREIYMTWEEFADNYTAETDAAQATENEEGEPREYCTLAELEEMSTSPLDVNTATRQQLMALPFLTTEQIDSLLSYRERRGQLVTLGELQFISRWDYDARRAFSLFAYCAKRDKEMSLTRSERLRQAFTRGKYELETRLDIPFYTREGQRRKMSEADLHAHASSLYLGSRIATTTRFRYNYRGRVRYGLTLQKDAGEPFGCYGAKPFDYQSFYFYYKPKSERWTLLLGDYDVHLGQGLVYGHAFMTSRSLLTHALSGSNGGSNNAQWRSGSRLTPHTSADETRYLRGVAGSADLWRDEARSRRLSLTLFASLRAIDGRCEGDTVRTLLTTGLHRSLTERDRRANVKQFVAGGRLAFTYGRHLQIGVNALYLHFDHFVCPTPRLYNRTYFHGTTGTGTSIDYQFSTPVLYGRNTHKVTEYILRGMGELAIDHDGHLATTHALQLVASTFSLTLQARSLAKAYAAPYADALVQNSHTQNEQGLLLGAELTPSTQWLFQVYGDATLHRAPVYRADTLSHRYEAGAQVTFTPHEGHRWTLRYRLRSAQQNLPADLREYFSSPLEYALLHTLRLAYDCTLPARGKAYWQWHTAADLSLYNRQSATACTIGYMLSSRLKFVANERWNVALFAAYFKTDDYYTRLYATPPRLRHASTFSAFAYHGYSAAAVANYTLSTWLDFGLCFSLMHYFDRDTISTGMAAIHSHNKPDLSLQVRVKF